MDPDAKLKGTQRNKETWLNQRNKLNFQKPTLNKQVYEFNTTIMKMLDKLRKMMHEQKENIDKENFKNQIKILDLKKISSFKNALEGFNNRLDHAEKKNQRTR